MRSQFLTAALLIMLTGSGLYSEPGNTVAVKGIEIRGLRNVEKTELLRGVRTKVRGSDIIIDIDSLKRELEKNFLIKGHSISGNGSTLIIEVDEIYPVYPLLFSGKEESVPCLAGENLNILKSGVFFKTDMPIIVVAEDFFRSNPVYFKGLFSRLSDIRRESPELAGELSEIRVNPGGSMKVALRNRNTYFIINNHPDDFIKLGKTAAFLDRSGLSPESLDLRGEMVLIK